MSNRIFLCLAHMSEAGWEQKYIQEAFDTNWVVPLGPNANGFEEDLKQYVGRLSDGTTAVSKEIVALSSGTAAVHLGLLACGVGPGDEVLVQSLLCLLTQFYLLRLRFATHPPGMIEIRPGDIRCDL